MFATVCLLVILSACAIAHALEALLRTLRLDPRETLLYLGLAEIDLGPRR